MDIKELSSDINLLKEWEDRVVINDPDLSRVLLKTWSLCTGKTPKFCVKSAKQYLMFIKKHPTETLINMAKEKEITRTCELKKGVNLYVRKYMSNFNNDTITDEVAIAMIKEDPRKAGAFKTLPEGLDVETPLTKEEALAKVAEGGLDKLKAKELEAIVEPLGLEKGTKKEMVAAIDEFVN